MQKLALAQIRQNEVITIGQLSINRSYNKGLPTHVSNFPEKESFLVKLAETVTSLAFIVREAKGQFNLASLAVDILSRKCERINYHTYSELVMQQSHMENLLQV